MTWLIINRKNIRSFISFTGTDVLNELNRLNRQKGSRYWNLNELRNIKTHRALINVHTAVGTLLIESLLRLMIAVK